MFCCLGCGSGFGLDNLGDGGRRRRCARLTGRLYGLRLGSGWRLGRRSNFRRARRLHRLALGAAETLLEAGEEAGFVGFGDYRGRGWLRLHRGDRFAAGQRSRLGNRNGCFRNRGNGRCRRRSRLRCDLRSYDRLGDLRSGGRCGRFARHRGGFRLRGRLLGCGLGLGRLLLEPAEKTFLFPVLRGLLVVVGTKHEWIESLEDTEGRGRPENGWVS
ncbi:hypothetical protein D9M71_383040 [compost metagenome]